MLNIARALEPDRAVSAVNANATGAVQVSLPMKRSLGKTANASLLKAEMKEVRWRHGLTMSGQVGGVLVVCFCVLFTTDSSLLLFADRPRYFICQTGPSQTRRTENQVETSVGMSIWTWETK